MQGFMLTKQVLYPLTHTSSSFGSCYVGDRGHTRTICTGWPYASRQVFYHLSHSANPFLSWVFLR
jgi:hypothetical protein